MELPLPVPLFTIYNNVRTFIERVFLPRKKGEFIMPAVDQLVTYIKTLTPEQLQKIRNHFRQISEEFEKQAGHPLPTGSSQDQ